MKLPWLCLGEIAGESKLGWFECKEQLAWENRAKGALYTQIAKQPEGRSRHGPLGTPTKISRTSLKADHCFCHMNRQDLPIWVIIYSVIDMCVIKRMYTIKCCMDRKSMGAKVCGCAAGLLVSMSLSDP
jgi:hypothetical protein